MKAKNCVKPSFSSAVHCTVPLKEKEAEQKRVAKAYQEALAAIEEAEKGSSILQMTEKDVEEQFYHMKQRLAFFAHDLFKAAITPGLEPEIGAPICKPL